MKTYDVTYTVLERRIVRVKAKDREQARRLYNQGVLIHHSILDTDVLDAKEISL